jgi:hypothetical protein
MQRPTHATMRPRFKAAGMKVTHGLPEGRFQVSLTLDELCVEALKLEGRWG